MPRPVARYYVYRNLHKGGYSVRRYGHVLYVADSLWLQGVDFKVSEAGRQRVLREKRKNVHAYCTTTFCPGIHPSNELAPYMPDPPLRVYYDPYKCGEFRVLPRDGQAYAITKAVLVALTSDGVFAYGPTLEKR